MKPVNCVILVSLLLANSFCYAQSIKLDKARLEANKVSMSVATVNGKQVVKVIKDSTVEGSDQPTYAKIKDLEFKDGTIEVNVYSTLAPNAPDYARGFIGIAFRISNDNSKFESIYIRPTNGRAEVQLRRNRSIQYFSYPDYSFDRLRKEAAGEYESYADMGLNEWIKLKIVVKGANAKLYLNDNKQPSLIVNDLKLGADAAGAIGLWVDIGTVGYFADLRVSK